MFQTIEELDKARNECRRLVTRRAMVSSGAAVVPVPGADVLADVGLLTTLLPEISRRFGLSADQVSRLDPQRAEKILLFAKSIGNSFIGRVVTRQLVVAALRKIGIRVATKSVTKYIPLIGSAVAATISFGAMKMLGNAHVDDCYEAAKRMLPGPVEAKALPPADDRA
jgi:uncharacterized protein (DUF697 family)